MIRHLDIPALKILRMVCIFYIRLKTVTKVKFMSINWRTLIISSLFDKCSKFFKSVQAIVLCIKQKGEALSFLVFLAQLSFTKQIKSYI